MLPAIIPILDDQLNMRSSIFRITSVFHDCVLFLDTLVYDLLLTRNNTPASRLIILDAHVNYRMVLLPRLSLPFDN